MYKRYMGSASYESNHERLEKKMNHELKEKQDIYVEGVSILVDYKGAAQEVIRGLAKGVQSGLSYCGAHTIDEMQKKAEFIRITESGWQESQTHGMKLSE